MKIKLVFEDWIDKWTGKSIYDTLWGVSLSLWPCYKTMPESVYLRIN